MNRLPAETVCLKRKLDSDRTDEEYLLIQDDISGSTVSQRFVYKRKRPRTADLKKDSTAAVAPSRSSAFINQPSQENHIARDAVLSVTNKENSDGPRSTSTTNPAGQEQERLIPQYHIKQRKPEGTQFSFAKSRPKTKPHVLFETRQTADKKVVARPRWKLPTKTTPAPPLNQQNNVPRLAPLRNVKQTSGQTMAWNASNEEVNEAMKAYTLDSIGLTLAETTQSTPVKKVAQAPIVNKNSPSRFRPKAPVQRYFERHPEEDDGSATQSPDMEMVDIEDEESYIIDEFVRVPIEELGTADTMRTIGILVIDAQEDVDVFYDDGSDDEEEIYDEEEDENAESHPCTEYPDEEVDSDDEYGRNPYLLYRKHGASDDEEFDEDEATFSEDDDVVGSTRSWARKPPWMKSSREIDEEREAEEWN